MRAVLDRRAATGGTAPARVKAEVERWQHVLTDWATGFEDDDGDDDGACGDEACDDPACDDDGHRHS